jgi:hypothetical protein
LKTIIGISSGQYVRYSQDLDQSVPASFGENKKAPEQGFPDSRETVLPALWRIFKKMQVGRLEMCGETAPLTQQACFPF